MPFNPLDYPLAWRDPAILSTNTDFVGHIPFVMTLVDLLKPAMIVELGTDTGNSYCAFCQAVKVWQLPTRCFAVDRWHADSSMGRYDGEIVLNTLRQFHDPNFGHFSTLLRMEFDAARPRFADRSIDLLHIDGCHTYGAVRHDFETWRSALSPRAVVVFHDTCERGEGFGVWKLWEEVASQHANFNFGHCHGLGLLQVGPQPEPRVRDFLAIANAESQTVQSFFQFVGRRIEQLQTLIYAQQTLVNTQAALNRWCAASGRPVSIGNPGLANADPMCFFENFSSLLSQALQQ